MSYKTLMTVLSATFLLSACGKDSPTPDMTLPSLGNRLSTQSVVSHGPMSYSVDGHRVHIASNEIVIRPEDLTKLHSMFPALRSRVLLDGTLPLPPADVLDQLPGKRPLAVPPMPRALVELQIPPMSDQAISAILQKAAGGRQVSFNDERSKTFVAWVLQAADALDADIDFNQLYHSNYSTAEHPLYDYVRASPWWTTQAQFSGSQTFWWLNEQSTNLARMAGGEKPTWEMTTPSGAALNGQGVSVAVIDVGFAPNNMDLVGYDPLQGFSVAGGWTTSQYDFTDNDYAVCNPACWSAPGLSTGQKTHGAVISQLIFGTHDNHYGVAGVAPMANRMYFRVAAEPNDYDVVYRQTRVGDIDGYRAASAVRTAASWGAKVINMSFGNPYPTSADLTTKDTGPSDSELMRAIEEVGRSYADVIFIASAGNYQETLVDDGWKYGPGRTATWSNLKVIPASLPQVISVGGLAPSQSGSLPTLWADSAKGDGVDVYAPASNVGFPFDMTSACYPVDNSQCAFTGMLNANLTNYHARNGTSYAAPIVSGIVALMKQVKPSLTVAEAREILKNTSRPTASPPYLQVNSKAALLAVGGVQ